MKLSIKFLPMLLAGTLLVAGCGKDNYSLGSLDAPSDVVITASVTGQDDSNPNGDGSGQVQVHITGKNALGFKVDFDASDGVNPDSYPNATATHIYAINGTNTYTITAVVFGPGGTSTTVTKDVTVKFVYVPAQSFIDNLIGETGSKTWRIDKDVAGHFGVGPWSTSSHTPEWYAAAPNEKAACCPCFYSARFTFSKAGDVYTLTTATPQGAFTKTGDNAGGLPGIPATGDEGCYSYGGGSNTFSWVPSGSGVPADFSTKVAILLAGNNTFIGYGAQKKEFEFLSIDSTHMFLRVQGTETGNAWYLRLIAD